ncbi:MaoC family dehydratase [Gordonia sp. PKS22-38]|uniref:MaoC family dehydratase n=1 Tax=Gordonia prachuapensis TaxID=3115651 RepID=A0ABU7MYB2_9ACTN|nr:MaoC family dehydratase [Gordonia sp. PKS22-38]
MSDVLGHRLGSAPLWDVEEILTLDRVRRYARASGDTNAIHIDPAAAHAAGLAAPVAHGFLLIALVLKYAQRWAHHNGNRITACDTRFVRPVYVGERPAVLHLTGQQISPGHINATVWILDDDGITHRAVIRPIRICFEPDPVR